MDASPTPVLVLFGPTASGKTNVLMRLSRPAEVVSADSMQVYRGMDIGTAKPSARERERLPHHLIDIRDPNEQFNAGDFVRLALEAIDGIAGRGALPVVCGGTGFYLKNLILGLSEAPPADAAVRAALKEELREKGPAALMEELARGDPVSAQRIHPNDVYRLLRALEVLRISGRPLSSFGVNTEEAYTGESSLGRFLLVGLSRPREELYRRIDARCAAMFARGLPDEVRRLYDRGYTPRDPGLRAIGYREFFVRDEGEGGGYRLSSDISGVQALVAQNSRRYAKRQITFFASLPGVHWLEAGEDDGETAERLGKIIYLTEDTEELKRKYMNDNIEAKTAAQAEMLANRLQKRFRHLRKWARRENIEAFRLYDNDIPEIPLVLDWYGAAVSGALYQRPYEKDEAEEERWLGAMTDAVARSLALNRDNIIIKRRERQRGDSQYDKIADRGIVREVREGELTFKVNLSDYLDTGLFLDRRAMRRMIGADSGGKRVLNLFCYTAAFSVYAAHGAGADGGGAVSTDSVDLSNTYLAWARENFALNGFEAAIGNTPCITPCITRHRLIRADVAAFLREAAQEKRRWDSIIVDPPAFSNSTMARADFDLRRDYARLLGGCLALLAPKGKLWFSASARSFKSGAAELEMALSEHCPGASVTDIGGALVDEDFKGKRIPQAFVVVKR